MIIDGTLADCLQHIATHFKVSFEDLLRYANEAPYADRLPARAYPGATGTPSERRILYAIARLARPTLAVECGVNWGVSTIQISSALYANRHGKLIAVDIRKTIEGKRPVGALMLKPLMTYTQIKANTDAIEYVKTLNNVDYLFEDTAHTYDVTYGIYEGILPNLSSGAWCISHDAHNRPPVVQAQIDLGLHPIVYMPDGTENGVSIWRNL